MKSDLLIAVMPGDGIGLEVVDCCGAVLEATVPRFCNTPLNFKVLKAGADVYRKTGIAMSDEVLAATEKTDAILFGAMGLPDVRYPDGTEIAPQLDLRFHYNLYAGVRPIRMVPGGPSPLGDPRVRGMDFVIIRESTEGLFAARGKGTIDSDGVARDTMEISRSVCERLFDFSFRLAGRRKERGLPGRVTCVDKANVFRSLAWFRQIFDERAQGFPDIECDHAYVDAMALNMVRKPWDYDVLVMENMFGDILSDLGAGLIGGMGMAPSADIGDGMAVFQPSHGTAPDIAGKGIANPVAMILSGAMMLDWLGERHGIPGLTDAAEAISAAVDALFVDGAVTPVEFGGTDGSASVTRAVIERLTHPQTA